jgi:hypothetical protein
MVAPLSAAQGCSCCCNPCPSARAGGARRKETGMLAELWAAGCDPSRRSSSPPPSAELVFSPHGRDLARSASSMATGSLAGPVGEKARAPITATTTGMIIRFGGSFRASRPYVSATMVVNLFRRALVLLIAATFLAVASPIPSPCADSTMMSSSVTLQPISGDTGNPAPCKGMDHGRCTELCWSCLGGTSLPQLVFLTSTAWSSLRYPAAAQAMQGRIPAPLLGPPISRA